MNLSQNEIVNKLDQFKQSLEENKIEYSIPNRMDYSIPPLNTIYIPNKLYNIPISTPTNSTSSSTPTNSTSSSTPTPISTPSSTSSSNKKGLIVNQIEIENGLRNLKRTPPNKKKEIPLSPLKKELLEQKNKKENPIIPSSGEPIEEKIPVNKYEDFYNADINVFQLSKIYSQLTEKEYDNSVTKVEIINKLDHHRQQKNISIDETKIRVNNI